MSDSKKENQKPKGSQKPEGNEKSEGSSQNGYSEEEVRKESSKAAKQAKQAQDKATELMQAAAAAGDPDERQKLMEEALEQQIQSKSLGKTAKYLRSGTFQGMAVGAGLGIAPGASLGAITGTLVGGVSSTALGGLGAGLGAATGWMHGPFWDMGKGGGKLIQKITGNLPGWKATEAQKKQLEKMVGQINEQDTPSMKELESMGEDAGGLSGDQQKVVDNVKAKIPSMPSAGGSKDSAKYGDEKEEKASGDGEKEEKSKTEGSATSGTGEKERKKLRKLQPKTEDSSPPSESPSAKKKPRILERKPE
ncbi:hypothetical protein E8E11_002333 [Didymella keratinophila]|nr:hypothetical protein E8E11_002333 [Didymella keratinophila]